MANTGTNSRLDRAEQILAALAENAKEEAEKNKLRMAENEKRAAENEKRAAENDRKIEELRASGKRIDRQLSRLGKQLGGEGNRWGKIIEDLVAGDLITIAKEHLGVHIYYAATRVRPKDRSWEIDVQGTNQDAVVVAEVKTNLEKKDIDHFLNKTLLPFTHQIAKQNKKIYGIIAYVKVDRGKESEVIDYAWSKGFLVVKAMDSTNRVLDNKNFVPHNYGSA
ncbi:MAG: hypothetical protein OYH77_03510 [Pseudomonadota bacterium]|nr:hypothetical protein [Pseudomonadota bacterium]